MAATPSTIPEATIRVNKLLAAATPEGGAAIQVQDIQLQQFTASEGTTGHAAIVFAVVPENVHTISASGRDAALSAKIK